MAFGPPKYMPGQVQSQSLAPMGFDETMAMLNATAPKSAIQAPKDRGMFGRFKGFNPMRFDPDKGVGEGNRLYALGAMLAGMGTGDPALTANLLEPKLQQNRERVQARDEEAKRQQMMQQLGQMPGVTDQQRALLGMGIGADQLAERAFAPPPEPKDPFVVNNQIVDRSDPTRVLADYRDPQAPEERWEEIPAPPGMPGLYERSTLTGQTRRVAAPPSGGIRIGPDGTVQIGGPVEGLGYGSAPKGKDAAIAFDRDGNPVVTPGPQQEQYNKAIRGLGEFQAQNAIVIEDIDRALNSISGWSTGAGAALKDLPIVGGITPAGQMESLLSTIQANVGFDKLQAMREASPTGGALGSVTEKELAFLQSVFGSLRQDTSPENVRYNLTRLKSHMQGREQRLQEAIAADFPSLATTAQRRAGANQQVQDLNDLLQFMTPEERALFEGDQ